MNTTAPMLSRRELELLRLTITMSEEAKARGRHPFAALVADERGGIVAQAGNNSMPPEGDPTQHAELLAAALAARKLAPEQLLLARSTRAPSRAACVRARSTGRHRAGRLCAVGTRTARPHGRPPREPDVLPAMPRGLRSRAAPGRSGRPVPGRRSRGTASRLLDARIARRALHPSLGPRSAAGRERHRLSRTDEEETQAAGNRRLDQPVLTVGARVRR